VRVWGTDGAAPLLVMRGQLARVLDVGFGPTSDRVVSAGDDGTAKVWDASGIQAFAGPAITYDIDFSPSGRWIATGGDDGAVRLWDPATGRLRRTLPGPAGYTTARFSPTADELVIGRDPSSSIERLPLSAPRPERLVQLPKGSGINLARFDPTGTRMVYADTKGKVVVRDLRSGAEVRLRGGPKAVYDVRISPDGKHAATATESGQLLVWRLDRPSAPERPLLGHRGNINTIDYSPQGQIVTAGADRTARVWDPSSRHQVILRGHSDEVLTAAFTRGGSRVLTTSGDGTVRLWDAHGGDALVVLQQTGDVPVYDVAQGRGGTVATLDGHWVVRVFRCEVCGTVAQVRAQALSRHPRPLTAAERQRYLAAAR
jgi:WD40 repeat protein